MPDADTVRRLRRRRQNFAMGLGHGTAGPIALPDRAWPEATNFGAQDGT